MAPLRDREGILVQKRKMPPRLVITVEEIMKSVAINLNGAVSAANPSASGIPDAHRLSL